MIIPLLTLVHLTSAGASIVGVMDSGTDLSHNDLVKKSWINVKEKAGSLEDLDGDGLPGDINGWDFTENKAAPFNSNYNNLITEDVKKFYNFYSKYELGQLTPNSAELAWLKTNTQNKDLMNKVDFVGGYIHGTHVAGIAANKNDNVKVLALKIIPTVYKELPKVDPNAPKVPVPPKDADQTPAKTVAEFNAELEEEAINQVDQMIQLNGLMKFHNVDVVNQSFGIGFGDAVNFINAGFTSEVKREPTKEELRAALITYFKKLFSEGPKMFAAAPNTIFAIAAGNDSSNNDLYPDYPAGISAENKIVVAATKGYKALADFSNYGATKVDVAAPGVAITSTAPTQSYIPLSGTSQATPYVTNIIAAMKDLNPALGARDLKAIVLGTVDVKAWLKGKVRTSGIVNKARALKAAELAKTQAVDLAISNSRALIADVAVEKSLTLKPTGLNFKFHPVRPSLLIKK